MSVEKVASENAQDPTGHSQWESTDVADHRIERSENHCAERDDQQDERDFIDSRRHYELSETGLKGREQATFVPFAEFDLGRCATHECKGELVIG